MSYSPTTATNSFPACPSSFSFNPASFSHGYCVKQFKNGVWNVLGTPTCTTGFHCPANFVAPQHPGQVGSGAFEGQCQVFACI